MNSEPDLYDKQYYIVMEKFDNGTLTFDDIHEYYRPTCTHNGYSIKQCYYELCWCSTTDGNEIDGTLRDNMPDNFCGKRYRNLLQFVHTCPCSLIGQIGWYMYLLITKLKDLSAIINFSVGLHVRTGNQFGLLGILLGLVLLLRLIWSFTVVHSFPTVCLLVLQHESGGGVNTKRRLFEGGVYFPQPANSCGDLCLLKGNV